MAVSYDFSKKTAVVTGGAKGIGRAIAERLMKSGARVWVWDITPVEIAGIKSLVVDVTQPDQIATAFKRTVEQASRIDILVNVAGYLGGFQPFERLERDEWQRIIGVNLIAVLDVCRQMIPYMRRAGSGRIVNMGSLAGKEGLPNLAVYSAASAGVIQFTKALAEELADTAIRENCFAPGPIDTDLIRNLGPGVVDSMISSSPMKRLGTVEEVAEMAAWLCSDACSFNTGAVFDMSGGRATY